MIDFVFLFMEGLVFFVLAMLTTNMIAFYTGLALLFYFDALWVGITNLTATGEQDKFPGYKAWAIVNIIVGCVILVFVWSNLFNLSFWGNFVKY